jgi:hypothetical protein
MEVFVEQEFKFYTWELVLVRDLGVGNASFRVGLGSKENVTEEKDE